MPLDLGEAALDEALAEPLERLLDAADVAEVAADADDHPRPSAIVRPSSIAARMRLHALGEADEDRLADQEMADVELHDLRQAGDRARRLVVEAVAGVAFEPERRRLRGGDAQAAELVVGAGRIAVRQRVAPGAGVQFDDRRAEVGAGLQAPRPRAR